MIVGVAEREGAIAEPEGARRRGRVIEHRRATGSILGFPGATDLASTAAALELDCDILIPAALENQITAENAPRVKAKIIARGRQRPDHARRRRDLPRQRA